MVHVRAADDMDVVDGVDFDVVERHLFGLNRSRMSTARTPALKRKRNSTRL